jgi:hypothetical protein
MQATVLSCENKFVGKLPRANWARMYEWSEAHALGGCAQATAVLLVWVYVVLFTQSYVKVALVQSQRRQGFGVMSYTGMSYADPQVARIKYNTMYDSPLAVVADRTAGNLLEQLAPFLIVTWLRAMLVPGAAASASRLTYFYVMSRMASPQKSKPAMIALPAMVS